MKKLFTGFMLLLTTTAIAQSAKEDYEAIAETVNYYLIGSTNNDFETLSKAFHSNANMTFLNAMRMDTNRSMHLNSFRKE